MNIEQIYTGCLAEAAYYIESQGEAVIIDPMRETQQYIDRADKDGAKIKYILETHFHADFVSGHVDLAKKTGATIVYGPKAAPEFDILEAQDNQELKVGAITLKVLHTPGHTPESTCYLLIDENGKENALFSGDTLFIGDVGRPDLAVKSDLTKEDLAGMLYDSLRNKVMTLPDDVTVYPAHGAGSACGKNLSSETWDTLGNQKATNYALKPEMTKDEFIKEVTDGIMPPPQYFPKNAMINKQGYESFDSILERGNIPLDIETFEAMADHEGALVLDTRNKEDFTAEHIPNSIFIGLDGSFAPWVGALIPDLKQAIVFVCDEGREEEVVTRLSRVGYDNTLGFLKGGMKAWKDAGKDLSSVSQMKADDVLGKRDAGSKVLDVRKPGEYGAEHVEDAITLPLDFINQDLSKINRDDEYMVHCASGYRSVVFISILQARGFNNLVDIEGGFKALQETAIPVTDYVCPNS
jgi:hydroxyacylglutathione hydrolase